MSENIVEVNALGKYIEDLISLSYPKWLRFFRKYPFLTAAVYLISAATSTILLAMLFNGFGNDPDITEFTEDAAYIPFWLTLSASTFYFLWIPSLLHQTFDSLNRNHIFVSDKIVIPPRVHKLFDSRFHHVAPPTLYVLGICLFALVSSSSSGPKLWWSLNPIPFCIVLLIMCVGWLSLASVLINIVLAIYLINSIFSHNEIAVYPFHPDRSGGLGALSQFSLRLSYLALVYASFIVLWAIFSIQDKTISDDYLLFVQVIAYFLIVPTFFYLPLLSAHRAMIGFRDKLIRDTSARFLAENSEIHEAKYDLEVTQLEEKVKKLKALEELQQLEKSYPIWPFNTRIRLTLLANALTPAVPTIVGIIIESAL